MTRTKRWNSRLLIIATLVALVMVLVFKLIAAESSYPGAPTGNAGNISFSAASTDRLVRSLQNRLASGQENAENYSSLGIAYLQKFRETGDVGYYGRAEEALRRALSLGPQDDRAMIGMGLLALSRHQFQEGLEWGLRAHQLNLQNSRNLGIIGDAYVELGRYPEAWEAFQQMVNLRPDLSSYTRTSYARELTGDIPNAIEAMNQALVAGGPNTESTLWTRVQLGHLYFNSGEVTKAEEEYRRALSLAPGYIHAQAALARVMSAKGLFQESIALYQAVIDRYPFPEYVIALGDVHTVAGNKEEAAQAYGLVRIQQRLYQDSGVNVDLELALFDADHHQNLLEALARARREYQRRPSIHAADILAWTLYKNGEIQEAQQYAAEALRLGTKDALMLFHAGMIHYRLGDRQRATELLKEAVAVNPHFSVLYRDEIRRTLETLNKESVEHRTSDRMWLV